MHTCIGRCLSILLSKSYSTPSPSKIGIKRSLALEHILHKLVHTSVPSIGLADVASSTLCSEYCSSWTCDTRNNSSSLCSPSDFGVSISTKFWSSPVDSNIVELFSASMPRTTQSDSTNSYTCSTRYDSPGVWAHCVCCVFRAFSIFRPSVMKERWASDQIFLSIFCQRSRALPWRIWRHRSNAPNFQVQVFFSLVYCTLIGKSIYKLYIDARSLALLP